MKAIVTVIDDDGKVIDKDRVIFPYDEVIKAEKDFIATITTIFRFGIIRIIDDDVISKKENE